MREMISKQLDQCVTEVCNDFNKILMERYNDYLQKGNQMKSPNINNSLLHKFCSFEEILIEAEVQKVIDQSSKQLREINDNFKQDEMLNSYRQNQIDYFKIKTILPSSCWKDANEKVKRSVEICCNLEYMKQGMKIANYIEGKVAESKQRLLEQYRSVLQQENKCLKLDGYHYYQITLASLPVACSIVSGSRNFYLKISFSTENNFISFLINNQFYPLRSHPLLVNAAGLHRSLKCVVQYEEYICKRSINSLKDMGYILNGGFVLGIQ